LLVDFLIEAAQKAAGQTLVAVATPLCSCGTTAIVLGMMATTMPWAPIVAFIGFMINALGSLGLA
jgi:hypothetical protein